MSLRRSPPDILLLAVLPLPQEVLLELFGHAPQTGLLDAWNGVSLVEQLERGQMDNHTFYQAVVTASGQLKQHAVALGARRSASPALAEISVLWQELTSPADSPECCAAIAPYRALCVQACRSTSPPLQPCMPTSSPPCSH